MLSRLAYAAHARPHLVRLGVARPHGRMAAEHAVGGGQAHEAGTLAALAALRSLSLYPGSQKRICKQGLRVLLRLVQDPRLHEAAARGAEPSASILRHATAGR